MKHKHSEVLKAWADGIECQGWDHAKKDWYDITNMSSFDYCDDARIKPEPKPDVELFATVLTYEDGYDCYITSATPYYGNSSNLKIIFDGQTSKLKSAEVIK
jgi:hypothetical protein